MKCTEVQRITLELGGKNLPDDCLDHLVSCAACREVHQRTVLVCNLIGLKKYEQPDPMFEVRNAAAVRRRLEAGDGESLWNRLLVLRPTQAYGYGLAAAAALVLAVGLMLYRPADQGSAASALVQDVPAPLVEPVPQVVVAAPDAPPALYEAPVDKPIFLFEAPSNRQPAGLQYGNGRSRLVGFEY